MMNRLNTTTPWYRGTVIAAARLPPDGPREVASVSFSEDDCTN
jgi:hypothetical protein